jgi:uncharacterized lipoprotein YajG
MIIVLAALLIAGCVQQSGTPIGNPQIPKKEVNTKNDSTRETRDDKREPHNSSEHKPQDVKQLQ